MARLAARVQPYDLTVRSYGSTRRSDPRMFRAIEDALGDCPTVLEIGAGTGSYEGGNRQVDAVEPSETMRRAGPVGAAPCVAACAEALPFSW